MIYILTDRRTNVPVFTTVEKEFLKTYLSRQQGMDIVLFVVFDAVPGNYTFIPNPYMELGV